MSHMLRVFFLTILVVIAQVAFGNRYSLSGKITGIGNQSAVSILLCKGTERHVGVVVNEGLYYLPDSLESGAYTVYIKCGKTEYQSDIVIAETTSVSVYINFSIGKDSVTAISARMDPFTEHELKAAKVAPATIMY